MPTQTRVDVFHDVVYENNAQEVLKQLNAIDDQAKRLVSRWAWELIQNARRIAGSHNDLQIEVVYVQIEPVRPWWYVVPNLSRST